MAVSFTKKTFKDYQAPAIDAAFLNALQDMLIAINTRLTTVELNGSGGIEVPVGGVLLWTNNSVLPEHFMLCEGQAISRSIYSKLYSVIGTGYGAGDGSTTFNIPDMRNRFPLGGKVASSDVIAFGVGQTGGSKTHKLTKAELPNYNLTVTDNGHTHATYIGTGGSGSSVGVNANAVATSSMNTSTSSSKTGITVNSGGSGNAIDILPPYLSFKFIIRVD